MARGALRRRLRWALLACAAVGLLVRFTVKDRWPGADILYYTLPLPVIACFLIAAGVLFLRGGRLAGRVVCFGGSAVLAGLWLAQSFVHHPCGQASSDFRALFWNTDRGRAGWNRILADLRWEEPTVIGLVEAQVDAADPEAYWKKRFPGYSVRAPGRGLVLLVRGEITRTRLEEFGRRSRLMEAGVRVAGRSLRIVLVDLEADPLSPRGPLMERVEAVAGPVSSEPAILLGDFNTLGDSVWFEGLRRNYSDLFEQTGSGMLSTWPSFSPVLALDHVWVSASLVPVCAGKRTSLLSDHARVWGDLLFTPDPSAAPPAYPLN